MIGFFLGLMIIYGLANLYVGLRGQTYLKQFFPKLNSYWYWPLFSLIAGSYLVGMSFKGSLPAAIESILVWLGAYWMAALIYLVLLLALVDLAQVWLPIKNSQRPTIAVGVLVATLGILGYGSWNAQHPQFRQYQVQVMKPAAGLNGLRIAMISDIHLGREVGIDRLQRMVDMANQLQPDLVVIVGDFTDRDYNVLERASVSAVLRQLQPRLGSYAVMGNHDYYGGMAAELVDDLEQGGVRVLRDDSTLIADSVYLVGREDRRHGNPGNGSRRMELSQLLAGIDIQKPVILLDHQPAELEQADQLGIDLMLAGHTHNGQLFPFNLITRYMFENDWGYLQKEHLQSIVSCGFGTWGPPVRLGNTPEVVDITVQFTNQ